MTDIFHRVCGGICPDIRDLNLRFRTQQRLPLHWRRFHSDEKNAGKWRSNWRLLPTIFSEPLKRDGNERFRRFGPCGCGRLHLPRFCQQAGAATSQKRSGLHCCRFERPWPRRQPPTLRPVCHCPGIPEFDSAQFTGRTGTSLFPKLPQEVNANPGAARAQKRANVTRTNRRSTICSPVPNCLQIHICRVRTGKRRGAGLDLMLR